MAEDTIELKAMRSEEVKGSVFQALQQAWISLSETFWISVTNVDPSSKTISGVWLFIQL